MRIRILISILASIHLFSSSVNSASIFYEEHAIKTAFLYRSLHYVEWPDKNRKPDSIVICEISDDKFDQTIESLRNRTVNGRRILIKKISSFTDTEGCNVFHVPMMNTDKLRTILIQLDSKNILTISEHHGFAKQGVILNFPTANQKVTIEINIDAANKQNIRFSAKLLRIAKIIGE